MKDCDSLREGGWKSKAGCRQRLLTCTRILAQEAPFHLRFAPNTYNHAYPQDQPHLCLSGSPSAFFLHSHTPVTVGSVYILIGEEVDESQNWTLSSLVLLVRAAPK